MKVKPSNILLLTFLTFVSQIGFSQIRFEKGYFVRDNFERVECLIKNQDWKNNPIEFVFKLEENTPTQKASISEVKEFGVYGVSKFIKVEVDIDYSPYNINSLDYERNPSFVKEKLFLRVLQEGGANLYRYENSDIKRFFFNTDSLSTIKQLVYKKYRTSTSTVSENETYKQQLLLALKCKDLSQRDFEKLRYEESLFASLFKKYNQCSNTLSENYIQKNYRDAFNFSLRPRLNSNNLKVYSDSYYDFGNSTSAGLGLETEFILPFNKNKWGFFFEPTVGNYKVDNIPFQGGNTRLSTQLKYLELPLGVRYYSFFNSNSKGYLSLGYVYAMNLQKELEVNREDGSKVLLLATAPGNNLYAALGYKYKNKLGLEVRGQKARAITNYYSKSTEFRSFSLVFIFTFSTIKG